MPLLSAISHIVIYPFPKISSSTWQTFTLGTALAECEYVICSRHLHGLQKTYFINHRHLHMTEALPHTVH
jgi:hypothetical protein